MNLVKLKNLLYSPILGEWGKDITESPLGDGIVKIIRTANFLPTGKIDYSNITQRAILKKKKTENKEKWVVDESKIETKQLKDKDLVIEKSGGGPKTPVGRVVLFEVEKKDDIYLCSNFLSVLRAKEEIVIPEYLLYQFRFLYQKNKVKKYQNQTTGIYNLKLGKYLDIEIDLPPKSEQSIIVAKLNKIQELIDLRVRTIDLLDEYIKSVFLEMFGDPLISDKNNVQLSKVLEDIIGGWSPSEIENVVRDSVKQYAILKQSAITKKHFIPNEHKVLIKKSLIKKELLVNKGEVLFSRKNTNKLIGATVYIYENHHNLIIPDTIFKLIYKPKLIKGIYLNYLFNNQNFSLKIRRISKGFASSMKGISQKKLLKLKIPLPDINDQLKFEVIALKINEHKQKCEEYLKLLRDLFQVSLQNAFSEEIAIDEEELLEDILQNFSIQDLKKGERIQYLLNWINDKRFSTIEKYNSALAKLLLLLEDGSIEQYLDGDEIKLRKTS